VIELKLVRYITEFPQMTGSSFFFFFLARAVSDCLKAKFTFEGILVLLFSILLPSIPDPR
jgi:hypothetical protein